MSFKMKFSKKINSWVKQAIIIILVYFKQVLLILIIKLLTWVAMFMLLGFLLIIWTQVGSGRIFRCCLKKRRYSLNSRNRMVRTLPNWSNWSIFAWMKHVKSASMKYVSMSTLSICASRSTSKWKIKSSKTKWGIKNWSNNCVE